MKKRMITILFLLFIISTGIAETYALIMGAGNYRDSDIENLPMAIRDAEKIKNAMVDSGLVVKENCICQAGNGSFRIQ